MSTKRKSAQSSATKAIMKVLLGLILLTIGTWLIWLWRWDVLMVIRGFLGIAVIFIGVLFLAIAKE